MAYLGLGVPVVFVFMGPAMVVGTYIAMAGRAAWGAILVSISVCFLAAGILHINDIRDLETDIVNHKHTLTTFLGRRGSPARRRRVDRVPGHYRGGRNAFSTVAHADYVGYGFPCDSASAHCSSRSSPGQVAPRMGAWRAIALGVWRTLDSGACRFEACGNLRKCFPPIFSRRRVTLDNSKMLFSCYCADGGEASKFMAEVVSRVRSRSS